MIKKMISSILKKLKTMNKRTIIILFAIILWFFVFSDVALAATPGSSENIEEGINGIIKILKYALSLLSLFMALFAHLIAIFLSPIWTSGAIFWLGEYLKVIWVMVSNLVYVIFAIILVRIAFINIIWKWGEKYELKKSLPKLIIWILIVPFSWFFIQFVLSISWWLTISALTLPSDTFEWYKSALNTIKIPKNCEIDMTKKSQSNSSWTGTSFVFCGEEKVPAIDVFNWKNSTDSIFWVIAMYVYWVVWLENVDKFVKEDLKNIRTIYDLSIRVLLDLIFFIVYIVLFISIWLVISTRWIYLWIYTMISPLFGLMYFFDKHDWFWDWDGILKKLNIKDFISLAMVPVYTMLALSFWLLFLYIVWNWMTSKTIWIDVFWVAIEPDKDETKLTIWVDNKFSLTIKAPKNETNISEFFKSISQNTLWAVWVLIMQIFGIVILWWAVMAALRSSKITSAIVDPIYKFGENVWRVARTLPQYAPIFPGGQSMKSLETFWGHLSNKFETKSRGKWNELAERFWLMPSKFDESIDKINRAVNINDKNGTARGVNDLVGKADNLQELLSDKKAIDSLLKSATVLEVEEGKRKAWNIEKLRELLKAIKDKGEKVAPGSTTNINNDWSIRWGTSTVGQSRQTVNDAQENANEFRRNITITEDITWEDSNWDNVTIKKDSIDKLADKIAEGIKNEKAKVDKPNVTEQDATKSAERARELSELMNEFSKAVQALAAATDGDDKKTKTTALQGIIKKLNDLQ